MQHLQHKRRKAQPVKNPPARVFSCNFLWLLLPSGIDYGATHLLLQKRYSYRNKLSNVYSFQFYYSVSKGFYFPTYSFGVNWKCVFHGRRWVQLVPKERGVEMRRWWWYTIKFLEEWESYSNPFECHLSLINQSRSTVQEFIMQEGITKELLSIGFWF